MAVPNWVANATSQRRKPVVASRSVYAGDDLRSMMSASEQMGFSPGSWQSRVGTSSGFSLVIGSVRCIGMFRTEGSTPRLRRCTPFLPGLPGRGSSRLATMRCTAGRRLLAWWSLAAAVLEGRWLPFASACVVIVMYSFASSGHHVMRTCTTPSGEKNVE